MKYQNVDLFKADKAMSDRVAEFMQKKVWGITLTTRYKKDVEDCEATISGLEKLKGSILAKSADEDILAVQQRMADLKAKLDKQKEEEASFEYSKEDTAMYNGYKKATTVAQIHTAIEAWFRVYGLEVCGSTLINEIISAVSGERFATNRTIVNSGATTFTGKRSKTDFLKVFYGKLSEKMLEAGTLKATAIPEDIQEYFAPKKKEGKKTKKNKGVK